jgi:hypothetical protein
MFASWVIDGSWSSSPSQIATSPSRRFFSSKQLSPADVNVTDSKFLLDAAVVTNSKFLLEAALVD